MIQSQLSCPEFKQPRLKVPVPAFKTPKLLPPCPRQLLPETLLDFVNHLAGFFFS